MLCRCCFMLSFKVLEIPHEIWCYNENRMRAIVDVKPYRMSFISFVMRQWDSFLLRLLTAVLQRFQHMTSTHKEEITWLQNTIEGKKTLSALLFLSLYPFDPHHSLPLFLSLPLTLEILLMFKLSLSSEFIDIDFQKREFDWKRVREIGERKKCEKCSY